MKDRNLLSTHGIKLLVAALFFVGFGVVVGGVVLRDGGISYGRSSSQSYQGPRAPEDVPQRALESAQRIEKALQYAAQKVQPAVVTVYTRKEVRVPGFPFFFGPDPFGETPDAPFTQKREVTGLGSGMIIRENGYILTNNHVVENVDDISVMLANQQRVDAKLVGTDPLSDLAVVKVDRSNLPTVEFADSDKVHVGQWAIAVGSPFSLRNSVSFGHVSALHRAVRSTVYEDFIQTDAPINRGNSGGPLVDIEGRVIGVNTLIQSTSGGSQGIGFANASNLARRTASDLIEYGYVKRPWLGVSIQELATESLREHFGTTNGVIVANVEEGSPAEKAGLQRGDLIVSFNDQPIQTAHELQRKVIAQAIGDDITLGIRRDGDRRTLSVRLEARPTSGASQGESDRAAVSNPARKLGLALGRLTPEEAQRFELELSRPVLVVNAVQRGSVADRVGLQENDLILSVDRDPIDEVDTFNQYLARKVERGASSVLLLIQRDRNSFFAALPLEGL